MIQHLVLAMHTPGRVDILLHDHAFGIAFSGKTTKTQGHSIKVVGERGLLCPKQAAQKMLYKMVDAPGSCLRLQSWEICDSVLTRLICEESAREGAMLAAHCYRNVPLAGKSASSRGNSLQKIAFEVDRIRHPHSVLRSSVGELDLIGTRKLQRRGFARGSADWLRDSVRVEFKSSKLRWSEWHSGWLVSFHGVKFSLSSSTLSAAAFDELWLGLYSPMGLHILKHVGNFGVTTRGIRTQAEGHAVTVYGPTGEEDPMAALQVILGKFRGAGCEPLAVITW